MTIDFKSIRAWNNSKHSAFEELCCQLAHAEPHPAGAQFRRKGTPDAGVECFWTLPDNSEHVWQAKFFFTFGKAQRAQLDDSIKTALDKHPLLTCYTVCLPFDLSDGRIGRQWSQLQHWKARVTQWRSLATVRRMNVAFVLWGQHELAYRLSHESNAGRRFFWFHDVELSGKWLVEHLNEVNAKVGPRYTPAVHVDLPVAELFDGLGGTLEFVGKISSLFGDVKRSLSRSRLAFQSSAIVDLIGAKFQQLDACTRQMSSLLSDLQPGCNVPFPLDELCRLVASTGTLAQDCAGMLEQREYATRATAVIPHGGEGRRGNTSQPYRDAWNQAQSICASLVAFDEFLDTQVALLATKPFLFLRGDAGQGKTHLFCDVARQRIARGAPTLVLLGQHFHAGDPWHQIIHQLHLSCSRDELLGALDAASEASGMRGLILIDAINESHRRDEWRDYLPAMVQVVQQYRHLGLAVSCRSSYVPLVARDDLLRVFMVDAEHPGFAEQEFEATRSFFDHYGIQRPSVPLLQPEFQNPLFLKVFCEGLRRSGKQRIPEGSTGMSKVFELFLDSVDDVLWQPAFLDYRKGAKVVHQAIDALAARMDIDQRALPLDEANHVCHEVLPRTGYSQSLLSHLLAEGVLWEDIAYVAGEEQPCEVIRFAYERFADHAIARNLLESISSAGGIVPGSRLHGLFADSSTARHNSGVIDALSIQVPEKTGQELFDVVPCSRYPVAREGFLTSLLWRDPKSISERTVDCFEALIDDDKSWRDAWETLIALATIPGHSLNARSLHGHLMDLPLAERDARWSVVLAERFGQKGAIDRLLDWAWPLDAQSRGFDGFEDQSIELAAITVMWFLTTSDRFVRDRATKALVSLLHGRLHILRRLVELFADVNDPYVAERLYAVAYGCTMLNSDRNEVQSLARLVFDVQFAEGTPTPHILLRDYARGIVEYAVQLGCDLDRDADLIHPPYKSEWPLASSSFEESSARYERPEYYSILSSLGDLGDFYCYTMSCLGDWSQHPLDKHSEAHLVEGRTTGGGVDHGPREDSRDFEDWCASLSKEAQRMLEEYCNTIGEVERRDKLDELVASLTDAERAGLHSLTEAVRPAYDPRDHFDKNAARGWIFERVISLGWTPGRFKVFDDHVRRGVRHDSRAAHKAERIGKKYQWIALHEYLAHVADNRQFGPRNGAEPGKYDGPWQIRERDIDPSLLLRQSHDVPWQSDPVSWWSPIQYAFAGIATEPVRDWLRNWRAIPDPEHFIETVWPKSQSRWFTLRGGYAWYEPVAKHEEEDDRDRRQVSVRILAFVVPRKQWSQTLAWFRTPKHFDWDPIEGPSTLYMFLGEYPWRRPVMDEARDYPWITGEQDCERQFRPSPPCPLAAPAVEFHWERHYDCSSDETFSGYLPAPWLLHKLQLQWARTALRFVDSNNEIAAFDPSIEEAGPSALLVSRDVIVDFLSRDDVQLFWRVSAEKMILQKDHGRAREEWPGRVMAYWIYALGDGAIELKARFAVHTTVGPCDEVFFSESHVGGERKRTQRKRR